MTKRECTSLSVLALAVALTLSGGSRAEFSGASTINPSVSGTADVDPLDSEDQRVPGFFPNVEMDFGYDDNLGRTDTNTRSSTFARVLPELRWVGIAGKHLVRLAYRGDYAHYFSDSDEDFRDHFLGADAKFDLTRKLDIDTSVVFRRGHETRSAVTGGAGATPNTWNQWNAKVKVLYGRRIATAQVAAAYEHTDREYTNNGQGFRDYDADVVTLTGFYNLGPKTQLLVEPSYGTFNYPYTDQDNSVAKVLAGVVWNATAKTTGRFKVGGYRKNFDVNRAGQADASGVWMDAEVVWEPKTYSTVKVRAYRDTNDANVGGGGSYESSVLSAGWQHELTSLTELQVGLGYQNDDYKDLSREDDVVNAYLGVSHAITPDVTIGARYDFSQRDSSVAGNDFDDNIVTVGFKTTFD